LGDFEFAVVFRAEQFDLVVSEDFLVGEIAVAPESVELELRQGHTTSLNYLDNAIRRWLTVPLLFLANWDFPWIAESKTLIISSCERLPLIRDHCARHRYSLGRTPLRGKCFIDARAGWMIIFW